MVSYQTGIPAPCLLLLRRVVAHPEMFRYLLGVRLLFASKDETSSLAVALVAFCVTLARLA